MCLLPQLQKILKKEKRLIIWGRGPLQNNTLTTRLQASQRSGGKWLFFNFVVCCSVNKSCLTLWPHGLQHIRLLCPSLSPRVCANSSPCYLTLSSSTAPFSSCPQSFPASRSFPKNWLCTSGSLNFGVSASASVLPMNIQDWFFRTDWFDLLAVCSTTIWKHQFFSTHPSSWSSSHFRI